jgi:hypothetical protein
VADAYLIDRTVAERIVVVSSLGTKSAAGGAMGIPNGELDPWADTIVASRFRYVQVSAYYDPKADVPDSRLPELPANALGDWIAAKQPKIWPAPITTDQVAVAALALPDFATAVQQVARPAPVGPAATAGPDLVADPNGSAWLVTESLATVATTRFWELLLDTTPHSNDSR